MAFTLRDSKVCPVCGLRFENRKDRAGEPRDLMGKSNGQLHKRSIAR